MAQHVEIKHTETGAVGTCPVDAVPYWTGRGYEVVSEDQVEAAKQEDTPFNPDDRKATEVSAYLVGLDTSTPEGQAEYDRVVTAEKAGQNRSTAFPS